MIEDPKYRNNLLFGYTSPPYRPQKLVYSKRGLFSNGNIDKIDLLRNSKIRGLLVASRASSRHNQRRVDLYRNCFEVLWSHWGKWSNISLLCFPRILAHSCSQAPCLPLKASRHEYEYVSGARRHTYPHLRWWWWSASPKERSWWGRSLKSISSGVARLSWQMAASVSGWQTTSWSENLCASQPSDLRFFNLSLELAKQQISNPAFHVLYSYLFICNLRVLWEVVWPSRKARLLPQPWRMAARRRASAPTL